MGIYINESLGSFKSDTFMNWAKTEDGLDAVSRLEAANFDAGSNSSFVIAVVENGIFDAAAVAFDNQERDVFLDTDGRPCRYFVATLTWIASKEPNVARQLNDYCKE